MDKYDEAIKYLNQFEGKEFLTAVESAWNDPEYTLGGSLFQYCGPDGSCAWQNSPEENQTIRCGCLTQVKNEKESAYTSELTQAIRADECLPKTVGNVTKELLPVFAEWQRKLDIELRGVK